MRSPKMLLALVLLIQLHLGDFTCDICVTQNLLTSKVVCPICSLAEGRLLARSFLGAAPRLLKQVKQRALGDTQNPSNWTTCGVEAPFCDPFYKYRSIDGSCNNLAQPTWGMANTAYSRFALPNYRDRRHEITRGIDDNGLPLPRLISTKIFIDKDKPDTVSLMVLHWGQVVSHDIIGPKPYEQLDCCDPTESDESKCLQLKYPANDYFYSKFNVTCDSITRHRYTNVASDCNSGPAHQINAHTHAIDASVIYGSDIKTANNLRSFEGGRLRTRKLADGREFLTNVPSEEASQVCNVVDVTEPCYKAGDDGVNLIPQYTILVIILQRQHNKIAKLLQEAHPGWDDETLYQEARRISIAILQHIHYNEWLVNFIGNSTMQEFELFSRKDGFTEYKSGVNLLTMSDFVGAVNVAHSAIQGYLETYGAGSVTLNRRPLSDWMNRPLLIEQESNFDDFLKGLTIQRMQKIDRVVTKQITNLLLHGTKPYGKDLIAIDVLRGRDYGHAPYVRYLEICEGFKAKDFNDLLMYIPNKFVRQLKHLYANVLDIDLIVGGSLEYRSNGSRLGATFLCIFREQFYRKKWGDRFWYEVEGQPHSFSSEQLQELRKITLSKVICENADNITRMPLNSFEHISSRNVLQNCNDIPGIDISKF